MLVPALFNYGRAAARRTVVLAVLIGVLAGFAAALPNAANANPPGPHDPFGSVSSVRAVPGGIQATGWAVDPDALTSNATVVAVIDGRRSAYSTVTSLPNTNAASKYHTGATPGFTLTVPVTGTHTVCFAARNVGAGLDTILKCVTTPLGTSLTSAQVAAHDPVGAITRSWANPTSVHLFGWATDPDYRSRPATVVVYVDGAPAATQTTTAYPANDSQRRWPSPAPAAAGPYSAFNVLVPTQVGGHVVCVWAVNIGTGDGNSYLGCVSLDNRGIAATGPTVAPQLNTQVVTEAKKHIGQDYVWGATGPRTFDCSGLVVYSYRKFGMLLPRTSEQQALAAHVIPASRVLPGDLVFYHDQEGDVYHVGIYLGPGKTVAAIDTQEGVNYQPIWDPTTVTYGSFSHT